MNNPFCYNLNLVFNTFLTTSFSIASNAIIYIANRTKRIDKSVININISQLTLLIKFNKNNGNVNMVSNIPA